MEIIKNFILPVVFVLQEIIFHLFVYKAVDYNIVNVILFAFFAGMICNTLIYLFKKKYYKGLTIAFTSGSFIILSAQLIYYKIFKTFFSVSLVKETAGDAMEFASVGFNAFLKSLPAVILLGIFIPLEAVFIKKSDKPDKRRIMVSFGNLIGGLTLYMVALVCMAAAGKEPYSAYSLYFDEFVMDMGIEKLGMFTAAVKDVKSAVIPEDETVNFELDDYHNEGEYADNSGTDNSDNSGIGENAGSSENKGSTGNSGSTENTDGNNKEDEEKTEAAGSSENTEHTGENEDETDTEYTGNSEQEGAASTEDKEDNNNIEENKEYAYNVLDINFDELAANESDKNIKALHEYFASCEPTKQNEYTGMFEGYNLIVITAEGFSSLAVDKDITPTLYKLVNEGFVFENFYNPIWQTSTSDGEYAVCTGLIPTQSNNMKKSAENSMPYGLGHVFSNLGYSSRAYHNHSYTYYSRNLTHPNLGYEFIAPGHGMEITKKWPESDLEMMENVVAQFIEDEPFHTYFMTVSGHLEYTFIDNSMASKNREYVSGLDYSLPCKAYFACQREFDLAMEYLINALIDAGVAERTVIVVCGDHYPYGLETQYINEIAGHEVEQDFELYKSNLIIWSYSMKEPVKVDKYCSSVDILPTIFNLFGIAYDSRLFNGKDIFSDSEPLVFFKNRSFITDKLMYNSRTNSITPLSDEAAEEGYLGEMQKKVKNAFNASAAILKYDYYSYIKEYIIEGIVNGNKKR